MPSTKIVSFQEMINYYRSTEKPEYNFWGKFNKTTGDFEVSPTVAQNDYNIGIVIKSKPEEASFRFYFSILPDNMKLWGTVFTGSNTLTASDEAIIARFTESYISHQPALLQAKEKRTAVAIHLPPANATNSYSFHSNPQSVPVRTVEVKKEAPPKEFVCPKIVSFQEMINYYRSTEKPEYNFWGKFNKTTGDFEVSPTVAQNDYNIGIIIKSKPEEASFRFYFSISPDNMKLWGSVFTGSNTLTASDEAIIARFTESYISHQPALLQAKEKRTAVAIHLPPANATNSYSFHSNPQSVPVRTVEVKEEAPPKAFVCPISLEIMKDPVIVIGSGQTYDRNFIMTHFSTKHNDPLSGVQLNPVGKILVPNIALKKLINDWLTAHPQKPQENAQGQTPSFG